MLALIKDIGTILGVLAFAFWTFSQLREKRMAKRMGVKANPTRCGEMIARVETLEKQANKMEEHNREDHEKIFERLGGVEIGIAKLSREK